MTLNILGHEIEVDKNSLNPAQALFKNTNDLHPLIKKVLNTNRYQVKMLELLENLEPREIAFLACTAMIQVLDLDQKIKKSTGN